MKILSKSQFKPKSLHYFREVQEKGLEIIITDHGKPVVKVSPYQKSPREVLEELRNTVLKYDDPLEPVAADEWEALK